MKTLTSTDRLSTNGDKAKLKSPVHPEASEQIVIPRMDLRIMKVEVVSDSPLISHKWSTKAKRIILDKTRKKAIGPREAKNPEADFEDCIYRMPNNKPGFPVSGFKRAMEDACSFIHGMTKVEVRGALFVVGDITEIFGTPTIREDNVRIGMGADIRHRAEFKEWSAVLTIRYNHGIIQPEQIINLIDVSGFSVGIGDWRPQKRGCFGMFHVKRQLK